MTLQTLFDNQIYPLSDVVHVWWRGSWWLIQPRHHCTGVGFVPTISALQTSDIPLKARGETSRGDLVTPPAQLTSDTHYCHTNISNHNLMRLIGRTRLYSFLW